MTFGVFRVLLIVAITFATAGYIVAGNAVMAAFEAGCLGALVVFEIYDQR